MSNVKDVYLPRHAWDTPPVLLIVSPTPPVQSVDAYVRTYARSITWQPSKKRLTIFYEYGALSHALFARGSPANSGITLSSEREVKSDEAIFDSYEIFQLTNQVCFDSKALSCFCATIWKLYLTSSLLSSAVRHLGLSALVLCRERMHIPCTDNFNFDYILKCRPQRWDPLLSR